ncbi:hypothetical protein ACTWJ8_40330 (plasmid) [Streptomyces sp. SDT5-1]|uniref:hypothetical protein n=1 Tax=Streptomyces sp. SDT5-1 TaxID=3406418 RepID=UPI003FCF5971
MGQDRRLIQTAVCGASADSDEPVVCPTEPDELDVFRRDYADTRLWCGLLLGGCGGELATRRCLDNRVCHFYHLPDLTGLLPPCTRRSHGTGSADHLYVKTGTRSWLTQQGHHPAYHFVEDDEAPLGSIVDIDLAGHRLRIHMDPSLPADWNGTAGGELILGPGVPVSPDRLVELGYVNRIRFTTEGSRRTLEFGTQTPHEGTDWYTPGECEITPDGRLRTPTATRIEHTPTPPPAPSPGRRAEPVRAPVRAAPRPAARLPLQIGALLRRLNTAVRAGDSERARELHDLTKEQRDRCEGAALDLLNAVLTNAERFLTKQQRLRSLLFGRLKEATQRHDRSTVRSLLPQIQDFLKHDGPPGPEERILMAAARRSLRAVRARETVGVPAARPSDASDGLSKRQRSALGRARSMLGRLNKNRVTSDAERRELVAKLATALDEIGDHLTDRERRHAQTWIGRFPPRKPAGPSPAPQKPTLAPDKLGSAAAAVRGALKKAAREGATTTWRRLEQQLGGALPNMTHEDQVRLLIAVDEATPSDQALLSSLLAAADTGVRKQYPAIAAAAGLEVPDDEDDLRDVLDADVQQLHAHWRNT